LIKYPHHNADYFIAKGRGGEVADLKEVLFKLLCKNKTNDSKRLKI
jgi:hypothetical protein